MVEKGDCTILIADDEPDILELMVEEFEDNEFDVVSASCGNDAVAMLSGEKKINVILSDFKMPNGSGMTVLEAVNKMPEADRPLFFFVSGQADIPIEDCLQKGAKKFFTKPFDLDDLIEDIAGFLK
jgi:CheY-like chemotaxis protein